MYPRHFFYALCILVLYNVTVSRSEAEIEAEDEDENDEARNPFLSIALNLLGKFFKSASAKCLKDAGLACKSNWKSPKALINCAGEYFKTNKGKCALG